MIRIYKKYEIKHRKNNVLWSWGNALMICLSWGAWFAGLAVPNACFYRRWYALQELENFVFLTVKSCNSVNIFMGKFSTCNEEKTVLHVQTQLNNAEPKLCTLGEFCVQILLKSLKISLFWPKSIDLDWKVLKINQNIFKISLQNVIRKLESSYFSTNHNIMHNIGGGQLHRPGHSRSNVGGTYPLHPPESVRLYSTWVGGEDLSCIVDVFTKQLFDWNTIKYDMIWKLTC